MKRATLLYLLILTLVCLPIAGILHLGSALLAPAGSAEMLARGAAPSTSAGAAMAAGLARNLDHPLSHLLLQLLVIMGAARSSAHFIMALATTVLTGPLLKLFRERHTASDARPAPSHS